MFLYIYISHKIHDTYACIMALWPGSRLPSTTKVMSANSPLFSSRPMFSISVCTATSFRALSSESSSVYHAFLITYHLYD